MSDQRSFVHDMKNYLGIIIGYSHLILDELGVDDPRRADVDEIRKAAESALAAMDRWSAAEPGDEVK